MTDIASDTSKRFEIFVPSPKARLNMGKGNTDPATGPFGYTGVSLQSDKHLFIDCNVNTLFQTGKSYCGQVGASWSQYSNAAMTVSSTATMNVSAATKIIIASGAGQGQITALDHGLDMRLVPYNELNLHYVIDTLETGLFEFFHGRHTRHQTKFGWIKPIDQRHFFSKKNLLASLSAKPAELLNDGDAEHEGGFLNTVARSWDEMHRAIPVGELGPPEPETVPSLGPILGAGIATGGSSADVLEKLRFGFAGYHNRFDPYKYGERGWRNTLKMIVNVLKRFTHVALKYGEALQSLPIVSHAIKAMEAIDIVVGAVWTVRKGVLDSFPALITFKTGDDGGWGKGGIADEAVSGAGARVLHVVDTFKDERKAKITSAAPSGADGWPLSIGTTYRLHLAWAQGSKSSAVSLSPSGAQPATLSITAPTLSSSPEAKTLALEIRGATYTVPLTPGNTADAAGFQAALSAAIPASAATVSVSGGKARITSGAPTVSLDGGAVSATLAWTKPAPPVVTPPTPTQPFGPPPTPSPPPPPTEYRLTINGAQIVVSLGMDELATVADFYAAVAAAVGPAADVVETAAGVDVAPPPPPPKLKNANDTGSLLGRMSVGSSAYENRAATLDLAPPHLSSSGETETLVLSVDGVSFTVPLTPATTLHAALFAISQIPLLVDISGSGNGPIGLTTRSRGAASRIRAVRVVDPSRWTFSPSDDESGADQSALFITAAELVETIGALDDLTASVSGSKLVLEAKKEGSGSKAEATGNLADLIFGTEPKSETLTGHAVTDEKGKFSSLDESIKTLQSWNHELQKLPEDTRNLTRPLTNALTDLLGAVSAVEKLVKKSDEVFTKTKPPPPPEMIGLLANAGITLGTQDRIVGTGGKGIVFISDGGTGEPDRGKFVFSEGWVADIQEWSANLFKSGKPASQRSLGFRVLSDSVVDLTSTVSASLAAMGRAKAKEPRDNEDRRDGIGIGIARVLGSYASEIAGYEKVVISARAPGKEEDDGSTGGRVEIMGQRIVVGAVTEAHTLGNAIKQGLTDFTRCGTAPIELDGLAGHEHLEGGVKSDEDWAANPLADLAWNERLREWHPKTSHVDIHATTEIDTVVLPFRLKLTKDDAKIGVVLPKEADRKKTLTREKATAELRKFLKEYELKATKKELAKANIDLLAAEAKAGSVSLAVDDHLESVRELFQNLRRLEREIPCLEAEVKMAKKVLEDATKALDEFTNDWDAMAFPQLEITEDKIRLGFIAGSGKWEDFAYMEMSKDGIKMFQPKSKKPTFDLKKQAGMIADGTADAFFKAEKGDLKLKFKGKAESGPLKWDSTGKVTIG